MRIHSAVFGEIDIDDSSVYDIPNGLFGFEGVSRYALVTRQDEDVTLMWLQSVEAQMPCFVVFDPFEVIDGYEPILETSDLKALKASSQAELRFLVIAVVPDDVSQTTVNLKSPVVLNAAQHTARQVILKNPDYPIRFFLAEPAVAVQ